MQRWHALAALSILGFNGKDLAWINEQGGPVTLLTEHRELVLGQLAENKKSGPFDIEEAIEQAGVLGNFLASGGLIAGGDDQSSLGRLSRATNPPLCAFVRGNLDDLDRSPSVAIVGTRNPTRRGIDRCQEVAEYLVSKGCLIVSGGAMGIDTIAHKTALKAGQRTVVVLGDPLKKQGDERNFRIRSLGDLELITTLTTYGPWISPAGQLFATRNQYVAALADAVVVVEGLAKSGTLYTAQYAHRMNIPVWVIPGDLQDPFAGAANVLLEAGTARALVHFDTLGKTLALKKAAKAKAKQVKKAVAVPQSAYSRDLVGALRFLGGRASYDDICAHLECDLAQVQSELSYLEIMGIVHKMGAELVLTGN